MQKRTSRIWGAAGAIFLALIIAAVLASIARSSRSLGASLAQSSTPLWRSGQITVVVAQRQATIAPERRVRNRRNVARALATSSIPVIPSLSEADEQLIVSDADATDPEIAFDLAQGIGGPFPESADAGARQPAPVTLVPITTITRGGNVTIVPTVPVVAQPPSAPAAPTQQHVPTATPVRNAPTATASVIVLKPEASKTPLPPTSSPAPVVTAVATTKPPATALPVTAFPTAVATSAPSFTPRPTTAPATSVPPTSTPVTVQPTAVPSTPLPPTDVPTVVVPTTAVPTAVPTTAVPPTATTAPATATLPPTATPSLAPTATLAPVTNLQMRVYSSDNYAPQPGWQIIVYRQGSQDILAAAATGENGAAHMTLAPAGTRICATLPSGWRIVHPVDGCYYQTLPPGDMSLDFVVAPVG